jgi:hypothetical protein
MSISRFTAISVNDAGRSNPWSCFVRHAFGSSIRALAPGSSATSGLRKGTRRARSRGLFTGNESAQAKTITAFIDGKLI